MAAAVVAAASQSFDEVIVSTLPVGLSQWIHMDLPHRIGRALDRPVLHIETQTGVGT